MPPYRYSFGHFGMLSFPWDIEELDMYTRDFTAGDIYTAPFRFSGVIFFDVWKLTK